MVGEPPPNQGASRLRTKLQKKLGSRSSRGRTADPPPNVSTESEDPLANEEKLEKLLRELGEPGRSPTSNSKAAATQAAAPPAKKPGKKTRGGPGSKAKPGPAAPSTVGAAAEAEGAARPAARRSGDQSATVAAAA